jgi:hypothetical protein
VRSLVDEIEAQIRRLTTADLSEIDRRWAASLVSVSVQHLGLGQQVREAADATVQKVGAESLTRAYREILAATISSKEHLARATFDCFELPLPAACLEYISTCYGSSRYVVDEKEGHGLVPSGTQESSGGRPYGNLFGKSPSRIVVVSLIPWRSSRPNPFLDRQKSCIERVGVGTRHDPFQ